MKIKKLILSLIRIILGCTFIFSSILKLFSLEGFTLYMYSFGILSYVATTIVARIIIVCEFLLGIGLLFKICYQKTWFLTLLMLGGFTLFLIYIAMFRSDDNCHCFGDFIELNAIQSIVKNILLIALLFFVRQQEEFSLKLKPYIVTISILSILFATFIGFPPDALYNKMYNNDTERFDKKAFDTYSQLPDFPFKLDSTKNEIVGLVSATCKHCLAGNTKMGAIFERNQLDKSTFRNIIVSPHGSDSIIQVFKDTTQTQDFQYTKVTAKVVLDINLGYFPTYVFFKNGEFVKAINYKEIDEKEISEFLRQ